MKKAWFSKLFTFSFFREKKANPVYRLNPNRARSCSVTPLKNVHCDGSAWLPVLIAWKGHVANKPGRHCLDILNSGEFEMRHKKIERDVKTDYFSFEFRLRTLLPFMNVIFSNENHAHSPFFQVRVVAADFTGSIQTVAQQMIRSKLFATWRLSMEVGP